MYEDLYDRPMTGEGELPFTLPQWIARAPFEEYLGMEIVAASGGTAILTMPFTVSLSQGAGFMHGGALTALADTAVAMAIKSILPEGTNFVTMELSLRFHAPVRKGVVTARATTGQRDERTLEGVCEVFDDEGVKVATFQSVFRVRK